LLITRVNQLFPSPSLELQSYIDGSVSELTLWTLYSLILYHSVPWHPVLSYICVKHLGVCWPVLVPLELYWQVYQPVGITCLILQTAEVSTGYTLPSRS